MSHDQPLNWVVSPKESGVKLQQFILEKIQGAISGRKVKQAIDSGSCQINGKVERFASRMLGNGDRVVFYLPKIGNEELFNSHSVSQNDFTPSPLNDPSRILFSDDFLIVYDKPAGIPSNDPHLLKVIKQYLPLARLVHRLDRETTGVLVFAGNEQVAQYFFTLFKKREVKKTYLAIVDGTLSKTEGVITNFLGKLSVYSGQTLWGEVPREKGGLAAKTAWQLKKAGNFASVVQCFPETGRTHQIRVHMSGMGHPILGDHQYGRTFYCSYRPKRVMLHACEIAFLHPQSKNLIRVAALPPADFIEAETHAVGV